MSAFDAVGKVRPVDPRFVVSARSDGHQWHTAELKQLFCICFRISL
jgi:hypothetical protein